MASRASTRSLRISAFFASDVNVDGKKLGNFYASAPRADPALITKGSANSLNGMMAKMVKGTSRLVSLTARFSCIFSR